MNLWDLMRALPCTDCGAAGGERCRDGMRRPTAWIRRVRISIEPRAGWDWTDDRSRPAAAPRAAAARGRPRRLGLHRVPDRDGGINLDAFDAIHASPPCQLFSITKHAHNRQHPDLLHPVLDILTNWGHRTGRPWVIENVPGPPMPPDLTITLCGGYRKAYDPYTDRTVRLRRHRLFASNYPLMAHTCECDRTPVGGVYGGAWSKNATLDPTVKRTGGYAPPDAVQRELMGINWMTRKQLAQAIPPDYTEVIGTQLLDHLTAVAE